MSDSQPRRAVSRHERRLAERLARGDQRALRELQSQHSGMLRGYLQHVLRDRATAEDVLQQVMLEVWQRGKSFDPARGSLVAWLMTMARSRAIDQLRRQLPEPYDPNATAAMIDRRSVADDRVQELTEQWRMAQLLTRLPKQEAQLLRMRFHLDMSQSAIADATGIPLGTVKMRMVSALARLRAMMDEEGLGDE